MELEEFCTFFFRCLLTCLFYFFFPFFSSGHFFYRASDRERAREREREKEVVVIHSFISLAVQACICLSSSSLLYKRRRRRRKISQYNNYYSLSLSYPIYTIELILSFSCFVVVQFIYKFISTRIEKKEKTYTFLC